LQKVVIEVSYAGPCSLPMFARSEFCDPSRSPHQQSCVPQRRLRLLRIAAGPEVAVALPAMGAGPSRTVVVTLIGFAVVAWAFVPDRTPKP